MLPVISRGRMASRSAIFVFDRHYFFGLKSSEAEFMQ